jgi:hypothetical protein
MYDKWVQVEGVFKQAQKWVNDPWNLAVGGADRDVSLLHGYEFAQQRSEAAQHYDLILREIENRNWAEELEYIQEQSGLVHVAGNDEVGHVADDADHVEADEVEDNQWGDWGLAHCPSAGVLVCPLPPPPPPPSAPRASKRVAPLCPTSAAKVAKKPGLQTSLPSASSVEIDGEMLENLEWGAVFDPWNWSEMLTAFDADPNAQMQLVLLSQHSEMGLKHANNITAQVFNGKVRNVSNFILKAVQNARCEIVL